MQFNPWSQMLWKLLCILSSYSLSLWLVMDCDPPENFWAERGTRWTSTKCCRSKHVKFKGTMKRCLFNTHSPHLSVRFMHTNSASKNLCLSREPHVELFVYSHLWRGEALLSKRWTSTDVNGNMWQSKEAKFGKATECFQWVANVRICAVI